MQTPRTAGVESIPSTSTSASPVPNAWHVIAIPWTLGTAASDTSDGEGAGAGTRLRDGMGEGKLEWMFVAVRLENGKGHVVRCLSSYSLVSHLLDQGGVGAEFQTGVGSPSPSTFHTAGQRAVEAVNLVLRDREEMGGMSVSGEVLILNRPWAGGHLLHAQSNDVWLTRRIHLILSLTLSHLEPNRPPTT